MGNYLPHSTSCVVGWALEAVLEMGSVQCISHFTNVSFDRGLIETELQVSRQQ